MSMSYPAVVRLADEHAASCLATVAAGMGSPEQLDRLAVSFAALAEVTTGSVSRQWAQRAEQLHGDAMMARAARSRASTPGRTRTA